jgi:cell division septal protein FtsQ
VLIQEYKPLFRVHIGAQDWIFAGDGKILNSEQLKPESLVFLPELMGVKKFDDLKSILPDVQYFLEQLSHFAQAQTIQFDASDKLNWEMLWNQKLLIKIGDTSELPEKIRVLKGLYPLILSRNSQMQYIDLRAPQNATIKYH